MLIRFVTLQIHSDTHREEGVFAAAGTLEEEEHLPDYEREQLKKLLRWFSDNLDGPARFTRSTRTHSPGKANC